MGIATYLRTLSRLSAGQLYHRLLYRLPRLPPMAPGPMQKRVSARAWVPGCEGEPGVLGARAFRFLNEERHFDGPIMWHDRARPALWTYNLHYFADLNARGAASRSSWHRAQIEDWLAACPPGAGMGWDAYPVSLRMVNWIKWDSRTGLLDNAARASLAYQARWLAQRPEWHILGNHLFENAKALLFAGLYFQGARADGWRALGLRIAERELDRQILADGGHGELSPMYHNLVLEGLLDLLQADKVWPGQLGQAFTARLGEKAADMLAFARAMAHPDGDLAFFNDTALGIAPDLAALVAYGRQLGVTPRARAPLTAGTASAIDLPASGFVRIEGAGAVILADAGEAGYALQPGHAHADTLSFEMSLGTHRLLVNSGTSDYAPGPLRQWQRSTRAHNTVSVNDADSSEVWAGFRLGRRAGIMERSLEVSGGAIILTAAHDGYRHLAGRPGHRRSWRLDGASLTVADHVGPGGLPCTSYWHLHPGWSVAESGPAHAILKKGRQRVHMRFEGGTMTLEPGYWYPAFGVAIPNVALACRFTGPDSSCHIQWDAPAQ